MKFDDLTEDNFLIYAIKAYDRPSCIQSEFEEDLLRIKYLKRLFKKYRLTGNLKERLILNHIIVLQNVFGIRPAARILFYKLHEESEQADWPALKSFLDFLNAMPHDLGKIKGISVLAASIIGDNKITEVLKTSI